MSTDPGKTPAREPLGNLAVRPFGKYFLVRKLAEGGMAEIFLAKQVGVQGFEKNVVIKRMLHHLSSVPDFVSMFLDEARLASRLAHPNIVAISDLGHADGCYYICMEYLAGEDFSTMLRASAKRQKYVPLNVSVRVVSEAARGLDFAHQFTDAKGLPLNVVHRDVSPSNIFVTYTGQVKVLDFGIAKAESRVTNTTAGVVKGKYMYMAPEQARSSSVDRRADVFSLGVSLYEAIANVRPFAHDTELAILNAVLQCDYKPLREVRPDVPPELEAVVQKAMAARVDERYQTAGELADELDRFLSTNTSGSGGTALSTFMHSFFGTERVESKTRIDSLEELAQKGHDVPGLPNPLSPKTEASLSRATPFLGSESPTKAVGAPASLAAAPATDGVPAGKSSQLNAAVVGALAALAVLGLGAAGFFAFSRRDPPPVVTERVPAETPRVVDAGPAPAPDAAVAVAEPVDAGAAAVEAAPPPVQVAAPLKPRALGISDIMKVVGQRKADLSSCFEKNKHELPGDKGSFSVDFTIAQNGRVTRAVSEMPDKSVGRCVENEVKGLRFPVHKDREVTLKLPLSYTVKR